MDLWCCIGLCRQNQRSRREQNRLTKQRRNIMCTATKRIAKRVNRLGNGFLAIAATALAWLSVPAGLQAESPPLCTGNGSGGQINFLVNGTPQPNVTVHVGDTVFYQVSVSVA